VSLSAESTETAVVERLAALRVLPVATIDDPAQAEAVGRALVAGGLPCVEIAFRSDAAVEAVRRATGVDSLLVGAGTILSAAQAEAAHDAGAAFAVAPGASQEVLDACERIGLPFFPGVATPTEIERARAFGRSTLKVFPAAQLGGPGFLRAVAATYPDVRFLPTGGISPENVRDYLAVPSVLAAGGSWLVRAELLREGRFDEVERLAREAVELAA
jgi:2-dehydro-3-deoxyphosphogluconate aldolase/(4S)-4-hydroxy-2-oxoglutarate aldolase